MQAAAPLAGAGRLITNPVVDTLASGPGDCTLPKQCTLVTAVAAAASGSTITFSVTGTIPVTSTISTATSVTLNGAGKITLDGGGTTGPLLTLGGETSTFAVSGLTFQNGYSATGTGGLVSGARVTLSDVTFTGNRSGSATAGGAVSNLAGNLTVQNGTFYGNTNSAGGAGDIYNGSTGAVTASYSTFVGGGGSAGDSSVETDSSSFSYLYDDLFEPGMATFACGGASAASAAGGLATDASCGTGVTVATASQLNLGTFASGVVPLLPGSAAIDAAVNLTQAPCPGADGRGVARPKGSACDAGAYEFDPATTTTVAAPATAALGSPVSVTVTVADPTEAGPPTGTVTISDGGTAVAGPLTLTSGSASTTLTLALGSHPLTAIYSGDTSFTASTSAATTVTVSKAAPTVAVSMTGCTASPCLANTNSTVTLNASVTGTGSLGTPTGSVAFQDGSTSLGSVALSGGAASLQASFATAGPHTLTAAYSGDGNYAAATSAPLSLDAQAPSSVSVTPSASPAVYGNLSFAVRVTGTATTPTGTVGCPTGAVSLDGSGSATCSGSALPPGSNQTLTVAYYGDAYNQASTGTATYTVVAAATTTVLGLAPAASVYGQPVALTATVTASGTSAVPQGTVRFFVVGGSTPVASAALSGGSASVTITTLPAGSDNLTAVLVPATGFATSTSAAAVETVSAAATSLTLGANPTSAVWTQPVTLTATASALSPSTATPSGTVTFYDGTAALGTATLSAGTATLTTSALAPGSHSLTASLAASASFGSSTSSAVGVTVAPAATSTSISTAPSNPSYGQSVTVTVTVAASAPSTAVPDGPVLLSVDGTAFPLTLSGGSASKTLTGLPGGDHKLIATYAGSADLGGSSGTRTVSVAQLVTSTTLSVPSTSGFGSPLTLSATVTASLGTPDGQVVFFDSSGATVGSATLSGGVATLITQSLAFGTHTLSAVYQGSADYQPTNVVPQASTTITAATPTVTLGLSPSSAPLGSTVTATVTVAGVSGAPAAVGTATVYDAGTPLGTATLYSTGQATITFTAAGAGPHSLQAGFTPGDANYTVGASSGVAFTVLPAAATVTASASPNPAALNQVATLTANVAGSISGQTPTGTLTFSAPAVPLGPPTVLYTTVPLSGGHATTTLSWPFALTTTVTASYSGDGTYGPSSTTFSLTFGSVPSTVAVTSLPSGLTAFAPFSASFAVSDPNGYVPTGALTVWEGTTQLNAALLDSAGAATLSLTLGGGAHNLTAAYSGDASTASSSLTFSVLVGRLPTTTALTASPTPAVVGAPAVLSVAIGGGGAGHVPTGSTTISDAGTPVCTVSGAGGSCLATFATPGAHGLTASYGGDSDFAPSTATLTLTVNLVGTLLTARAGPATTWPAGDPVTVSWQLFPGGTGSVTATGPGGVTCSGPATAGSCTLSPTQLGPGAITVSFPGDGTHAPVSTTLSGTVVACVFLTVPVYPNPDFGSVETLPGPSCSGGRGYPAGTQVTLFPDPAPGYVFKDFQGYDPKLAVLTLTLTQSATVVALFDYACETLTIAAPNHYVEVYESTQCGDFNGYTPGGDLVLHYHRGATVTIFAQDYEDPATGPMVFDHWGGAAPGSGGSLTVTMDGDQLLIPFYVRQCFPVHVDGSTGGFATYTVAGLDCSGPQGAGAHRGDVVQVDVAFGPNAFLDTYSFAGPDSAQTLSVTTLGEPQLPALLNWQVSKGGTLTFAVNRCFSLDLGAVPAGSTQVSASPAPNCPLPGITGYRGGTVVDVGASFAWPLEWTKWNIDGVSTTDSSFAFAALQPGSKGFGPSEDITMDRDHSVRAIARGQGDCFQLSVGAADPGYGSASFTATPPVAGVGPYGDCPDGQYERGTTITGHASAHPGEDGWEVGWTYDGVPLDEVGTPLTLSGPFGFYPETTYTLPAGGIGFDDPTPHRLQAWFCPVLQVHSGGPGVPDGLYATNPVANNCPIDLDTWLPGTQLTLTAVAPKAAYTFQGWQGDGVSATTASTAYRVSATSATSTVTAVFTVVCHVLTTGNHYTSGSNDSTDATIAPGPDCPNRGAPAGSYRADTIVIAEAADHGGSEPFLGWSGDSGDSTLLTAVGMNQDRSLIANYDDSASDPLGSPTNFGLYWSKAGKVVLGTITAALGNIVFGVVNTGFNGLSGVLDLLGKAGVPDASTLANVVNSSTQLLESSSSCVGQWGVGGSSPSSSTPVGTTQGDALLIGKALKQLASDDLTPGPASVALTTATTAYSLGTPSIDGDWSWSEFSDSMSRCTLQHLQQADQGYGQLFSQRLLPPATALGPQPDEDRQ